MPLELPLDGVVEPEALGYVPPAGPGDLRGMIAARYERVTDTHVLVTAGASEALAAVALALVAPGDSVVHDHGTYPSFIEAARTAGARLRPGNEARPGDRLAAVCHPTTPDGALYDIDEWCRRTARAASIPVVDEVYRDLAHEGARPPAAADCCDSAISIGGLSKPLGMGGLRIGWIATRDGDIRARLDRQLQLLSGGPASLSVAAALTAMEHYDESVRRTLRCVRENAPGVLHVLDEAGWCYSPPAAGLTLAARPPARTTAEDEQRLREAGYFLIPCDMYGAPGAYRVSLLAPAGELRHAIALLTASHSQPQPQSS